MSFSTVTLALSIGSSASINAAYAYGLPGERGSRTVLAAFGDRELLARAGIGRGRGAVVSYTLYVRFPDDIAATIPNARALRAEDNVSRDRRPAGFADYLFSITEDEYRALTTTANPATAYVEVADIPRDAKVFRAPGIAIPTRYVTTEKVAEPTETVAEPETTETVAPRRVGKSRRVTA